MATSSDHFRRLPAVHRVLAQVGATSPLPRPLIVATIREALESARRSTVPSEEAEVITDVGERLARLERTRLQTVINATGVVLHTNLGRAPLGLQTRHEAFAAAATTYTNLELDLETGKRGRRGLYAERLLATLCDAEDALVVNNCAAALVLTLQAMISPERKEVLISRGELIQIGGGFRIPDILETSGAVLCEVGATNHTDLRDYQRARSERIALVLKTHWSNFTMRGFVSAPEVDALADWAHQEGLPIVEDLGSGAVVDTRDFLPDRHEPTPAERIRKGIDLVLFSGDKLLGGPQAGVIVGRKERVDQLRRHPLYRALRCDKLILGALQDCVEGYIHEVPIPPLAIERLNDSSERLAERAQQVLSDLSEWADRLEVAPLHSEPGGGTLPETQIPSAGLMIHPGETGLHRLSEALRALTPPIIARIERERIALDFRTVLSEQDAILREGLRQVLASNP